MNDVVLDASVVMAVILREKGHEAMMNLDEPALISAVNVAEARSRLSDRGYDRQAIEVSMEAFDLTVVDFDAEQAAISADLRPATRKAGLSLGDRACLALAASRNAVAVTADRAWAQVKLPVEVQVVR